jgi:hypothetical protein
MFQGAKTEIIEREKIKIAVDKQNPFKSIITNYKKDGSIYKCQIEGYPVFNKKGNLVTCGSNPSSVWSLKLNFPVLNG